jgi:hypothetical protein
MIDCVIVEKRELGSCYEIPNESDRLLPFAMKTVLLFSIITLLRMSKDSKPSRAFIAVIYLGLIVGSS